MNFNKFKDALQLDKIANSVRSTVQGVNTQAIKNKYNSLINKNDDDTGDVETGRNNGENEGSSRSSGSSSLSAPVPSTETIELGPTDEDDVGLIDGVRQEVAIWFNLSRTQRLQAFALSFGVGVIMILLGILAIGFGNLSSFAVLYSLGNILLFSSSFFLSGFTSHLKVMFSGDRAVASGVAVGSIALTLCAAFWWKSKLLVLLFVLIQVGANLWYSLSYVPYARKFITSVVTRTLDDGEG